MLFLSYTDSDINICHEIPSRRRDGKRVVVCKFVSRKTKIAVLKAKQNNRRLNYRHCPIFINEHLCQSNHKLFSSATSFKNEYGFKYLWTRTGSIYSRQDDNSEVEQVINEDTINLLRSKYIPASKIHFNPTNNNNVETNISISNSQAEFNESVNITVSGDNLENAVNTNVPNTEPRDGGGDT